MLCRRLDNAGYMLWMNCDYYGVISNSEHTGRGRGKERDREKQMDKGWWNRLLKCTKEEHHNDSLVHFCWMVHMLRGFKVFLNENIIQLSLLYFLNFTKQNRVVVTQRQFYLLCNYKTNEKNIRNISHSVWHTYEYNLIYAWIFLFFVIIVFN